MYQFLIQRNGYASEARLSKAEDDLEPAMEQIVELARNGNSPECSIVIGNVQRRFLVSIAVTVLLIVAVGCGDSPGELAESVSSPTRTPESPVATSLAQPATPVVNFEIIGDANLSEESKSSLADLIELVKGSVVRITTGGASGSGFIVDSRGLVVTNEHVVAGESSVGVWLGDGRRYQGDVLERDPTSDLALVQITDRGNFDGIPLGDPSRVRLGDEVLALGFPLADRIGSNLSVTGGIISSIRTVNGIELFQTDAALNPGNSGGPLINSAGEVIGVNSSKIEETTGGRPVSNIGFAISVRQIEHILPILRGNLVINLGTPTSTSTATPKATTGLVRTAAPSQTPVPEPAIAPSPTVQPLPTLTPTPVSTATPTPTPPFVSVSSGARLACGLRVDGTAVCRGDSEYRNLPPNEHFTSMSISVTHVCGLRGDGVAVCWGDSPLLLQPGSLLTDEHFKSISVGHHHNCGLREEEVRTPAHLDGVRVGDYVDIIEVAVCWGTKSQSWAPPSQDGRFVSISASWNETCALREDGKAVCWGLSTLGSGPVPPEGERFTSISSGPMHVCGLREDGVAVCWGDVGSPPDNEKLISISNNGDSNTCGLRDHGTAVCWGRMSSPPNHERFTSLSSGSDHACGLREDGTMLCWGSGLWNQFSPGDDGFISVSSGNGHTCGVREDGTIVCYGNLDWEDS